MLSECKYPIAMAAADVPSSKRDPNRPNDEFGRLVEPLRRELKLHCYRMLGSVHEAEDAVQETLLRAWRGFGKFEGRGSFRSWLYQIATNVCLNALAARRNAPRLLPNEWMPAAGAHMPDGTAVADVPWLEPYPDSYLEGIDESANPEARYLSREAVRLAFVAVIQGLPPRQRAALLLCDVLGWSANEAATLLGGSTASINSILQRARETLSKRYPDGRPAVSRSANPLEQELLGRYLRAWERLDVDGLVALLKEDATYTMPPKVQWYAGRTAIGNFFEWAWRAYESFRLVPTAANNQPAFAAYSRASSDAPWTAHSIHVLTIENGTISTLTLFAKPLAQSLFPVFDLPDIIPATADDLPNSGF
ncbi:sigma-70 family RNA polymerase sigma factor [Bradyrhizobium sp. STM 3562]|uniref:sigma-70 family RNA polymerase sigma factor n=1 Tax=Bradyrhizobium sp. STM 3562 TaxID=578924 RepID=UPI00388D2878